MSRPAAATWCRFGLLLCAGVLQGGHAATPTPLPAHLARRIDAQDGVEWCHPLAAGAVLHYRFRASLPVGFSLHWHRGDDGQTVLRRDEVRELEGDWRAAFAADYCVYWYNYGDSVADVSADLR